MKLTILFGGASYEHEISIVSAITLKEKLKNFNLDFIFCDTDHSFYLIDASKMVAKTFSSKEYKKEPKLSLSNGAFVLNRLFSSQKIDNVVLNLIHGADGEDGSIASLLEFFDIAFIGPRADACCFSFDKRYTKMLCKARGVKSLDFNEIYKNRPLNINISHPFILKPSRLGSSIGVSVVNDDSELEYALDVAFEFDDSVLVEPFIVGVREFNLAGYKAGNDIVFSNIEEVVKEEFLDFEQKYMDFSTSVKKSKADIPLELEEKLKSSFAKIYDNLFEGALIRCDFFVIEDDVYLNEINPIPGSMANYLFDDFQKDLATLASHLPRKRKISIDYNYIHKISKIKGK